MSWISDDEFSDDGLRNPFPKEFNSITIGTPINADTNEIMLNTEVFNVAALIQGDFIQLGVAEGETRMRQTGVTKRSQQSSGWSSSASMGLQTGLVDVSAMFYVQQILNACSQSHKVTVRGRSIAENYVQLKTATPEQLLACTTQEFRDAVKAITEAANDSDQVIALTDFYTRFGTGYIDRLELVAIGVFEASLISESTSYEDYFDVGGGVGISMPILGAKATADYFKSKLEQTKSVSFEVKSYGRPDGSEADNWADDAAKALQNIGLEQCKDTTVWEKAIPRDPGPPEKPAVNGDGKPLPPIPLPTLPELLGKAITALQFNSLAPEFKPHKPDDPAKPDEKAMTAAINAELSALQREAKLSAEDINRKAMEGLAESDPAPPIELAGPAGVAAFKAAAPVSLAAFNPGTEPTSGRTALLGGYAPSGYNYTEWTTIFPQLKVAKPRTMSQVVFGQALIWFSVRGEFAQYLDFCAQYPGVVGENLTIEAAANEFRAALKSVSTFMTTELHKNRGKKGSAKIDLQFVKRLEKYLRDELGTQFDLYDHYIFWINNYEWLKRIPFGVVVLAQHKDKDSGKEKLYYQKNPYPACSLRYLGQPPDSPGSVLPAAKGFDVADSVKAASLIHRDAYRLYPIISTDAHGKPHFVWVGAPTRLGGPREQACLAYSGLLSFYRTETAHPSCRPPGQIGDLNDTALPMLIHQSSQAVDEFVRAKLEFNSPPGPFNRPPSGVQLLRERWDNRKSMFGMNLYPGVGDRIGLGSQMDLLEAARQLAFEASKHGSVLPAKEKTADGKAEKYGDMWRLQDPEAAMAAYCADQDALFLWGPRKGPWWADLQPCELRFVPIDYKAVSSAGGVKSGGRPMWLESHTDDLVANLNKLADPEE